MLFLKYNKKTEFKHKSNTAIHKQKTNGTSPNPNAFLFSCITHEGGAWQLHRSPLYRAVSGFESRRSSVKWIRITPDRFIATSRGLHCDRVSGVRCEVQVWRTGVFYGPRHTLGPGRDVKKACKVSESLLVFFLLSIYLDILLFQPINLFYFSAYSPVFSISLISPNSLVIHSVLPFLPFSPFSRPSPIPIDPFFSSPYFFYILYPSSSLFSLHNLPSSLFLLLSSHSFSFIPINLFFSLLILSPS